LLSFRLSGDDEAAGTLERGEELWVRIDVPAFIEPILLRGRVKSVVMESLGSEGESFVELEPKAVDEAVAHRLELMVEILKR
jgi:hypothetical protein